MRVVHLLWIICLYFQILQLSHAHNINCTVTQHGGRTLYAVQRMEEAKHCLHSWINITGHVLANHNGQMDELVETNTNYSLRTTECFPVVRYEQNCLSEDSLYEANCNTNCTENASPDGEEGGKNNTQGSSELDIYTNSRHHWIIAVVVITIFAVCLLFWTFRNRLCRHEAGDAQRA